MVMVLRKRDYFFKYRQNIHTLTHISGVCKSQIMFDCITEAMYLTENAFVFILCLQMT